MSRPALASPQPKVRCAVYTRKSTEEGLEQDYNSLHAQRDACEAYVRSQAGEGWSLASGAYDDGGFSGGTLERPALKRLLADVEAGRVQVIVLYKIDRLTRSLADFSKIVEVLDRAGASFVSVTQAFNTTTSMGRLTLNMLLSFAQFEREVTGERIRDKIAASKRKGLWMGGAPPLGYDPAGRTLKINETEADTVRTLFTRYLELGSVNLLRAELAEGGHLTKRWVLKAGAVRGGVPFDRGGLYYLLSNRIYLGEIPHKGEHHPGLHAPLIARDLFEAVQASLLRNGGDKRRARAGLPERDKAPLTGLLFNDRGQPMSPVTTCKRDGRTYRYYVAAAVQQRRSEDAGSVPRLPAEEVEALVRERAQRLVGADREPAAWTAIRSALRKVEASRRQVRLRLDRAVVEAGGIDPDAVACGLPAGETLELTQDEVIVTVPAQVRSRAGSRVVVGPNGAPATQASTVDLTLLRALIRAESWRRSLLCGEAATLEQLSQAAGVKDGYARRMMRLAFLSPKLKAAILKGQAPTGLTLQKLMTEGVADLWAEQERSAYR